MSGVNTIWCTSADVTGRDGSLSNLSAISLACSAASDMLYALSGRRFPGAAQITQRPAARPRSLTVRDWSHYLQTLSGVGYSIAWADGGGWFGNADWDTYDPAQIDLGVYPVRQIVEVKIDGTVIPANEYRVDDFRYLVRTLPSVSATPTDRVGWPMWQNMSLPDTEYGTFSVTLSYGEDPPAAGQQAAITLAVEFAKLYANVSNRLPARIQSITRQGVSFAVMDPMNFLDKGLTGLYDVDLFIKSYNPGGQRAPALVWSPDLETRRRPGTTYP